MRVYDNAEAIRLTHLQSQVALNPTSAMVADALRPQYHENQRYFSAGIKATMLWAQNVEGEPGIKQIFRMVYAFFGPNIHKTISHWTQGNADALKLFSNKSHFEYCLPDMDSLKAMPEGSLGRFHYKLMSGSDIFPDYLLETTRNTQHFISGYISDFPEETSSITLLLAHYGLPGYLMYPLSVTWALQSFYILQPNMEIKEWILLYLNSVTRGLAAAKRHPIMKAHLEKSLPLPISKARVQLGISGTYNQREKRTEP